MRTAAIRVDHLRKSYGTTKVIDDLSIDIEPGELITLLGPSGCGKTTTLRCIGGFIAPDSGRIFIGDRDLSGVPPYRRRLGMVFQNFALFPHLTVFGNVAFGLKLRGMGRDEVVRRVRRALEMVQLTGFDERRPKQLSGGQQQRVALARALVYEPDVLLLDEPLSSLDARLRLEMRNEIRRLQQELGLTAVYVTHDQEEALSISDRVAVMNGGRIEQLSSPWDIYNRPRSHFVASFVGTANIVAATIDGGRLRTGFGIDVPAPIADGAASGDVWAILRPEAVELDGAEGHGLPGVLSTLTMIGAISRAEVEVAGTRIVCDIPNTGSPPLVRTGDRVSLRVDAARISTIPRNANP